MDVRANTISLSSALRFAAAPGDGLHCLNTLPHHPLIDAAVLGFQPFQIVVLIGFEDAPMILNGSQFVVIGIPIGAHIQHCGNLRDDLLPVAHQHRVFAAVDQILVKSHVGAAHLFEICLLDVELLLVDELVEPVVIIGAQLLDDQFGGEVFQHGAHGKDRLNIVDVEGAHVAAPVWLGDDELFTFEQYQGFTDWGAADTKLLGERGFDDVIIGTQTPLNDRSANLFGNLLTQANCTYLGEYRHHRSTILFSKKVGDPSILPSKSLYNRLYTIYNQTVNIVYNFTNSLR